MNNKLEEFVFHVYGAIREPEYYVKDSSVLHDKFSKLEKTTKTSVTASIPQIRDSFVSLNKDKNIEDIKIQMFLNVLLINNYDFKLINMEINKREQPQEKQILHSIVKSVLLLKIAYKNKWPVTVPSYKVCKSLLPEKWPIINCSDKLKPYFNPPEHGLKLFSRDLQGWLSTYPSFKNEGENGVWYVMI